MLYFASVKVGSEITENGLLSGSERRKRSMAALRISLMDFCKQCATCLPRRRAQPLQKNIQFFFDTSPITFENLVPPRLVRPILEYACPVWNPHLVKHIHSIESIQRRATRLICGSVKSYSERLAELNWSTLELRRKYLCLVQLYKIIHGFSDVDYTRYIDLTGPTRTRRKHDFKIRPRAVRTNYFKFSFFNRYVNDWNSLPNSVMSASSLNAFKNRLLNYLCT